MKNILLLAVFILLAIFGWSKSINATVTHDNNPEIWLYAVNPFEFTSIDSESDISLEGIEGVYPYPAKDFICIDGINDGRMEILNMQGDVLKTVTLDCPVLVIAISDLASGIYNVRIITDEEILLKKLIKE